MYYDRKKTKSFTLAFQKIWKDDLRIIKMVELPQRKIGDLLSSSIMKLVAMRKMRDIARIISKHITARGLYRIASNRI